MRKIELLFLCCSLLLSISSCNTSQLGAAATGTSLGGMFGSTIGDLAGGYRGHQIGKLVGMTAGAAVGIAATTPKQKKTDKYEEDFEDDAYAVVEYGQYKTNPRNFSPTLSQSLKVSKIYFTDANNNQYMEANEPAAIEITFYNDSDITLYDVSPRITCNSKHVNIASLSTVSVVEPDQRFRYRVEMVGKKKLKPGNVQFEVCVKSGDQEFVLKTFSIRTM